MDKHFLTPLFCPTSVAVFAGRDEDAPARTPQARALIDALTGQRFSGTLVFLIFWTFAQPVAAVGTLASKCRRLIINLINPHQPSSTALST